MLLWLHLGKENVEGSISPWLKKGQGVENKKTALLIFLRAHFLFQKALLNLKVYDILNM